jgi:hypothetical protein
LWTASVLVWQLSRQDLLKQLAAATWAAAPEDWSIGGSMFLVSTDVALTARHIANSHVKVQGFSNSKYMRDRYALNEQSHVRSCSFECAYVDEKLELELSASELVLDTSIIHEGVRMHLSLDSHLQKNDFRILTHPVFSKPSPAIPPRFFQPSTREPRVGMLVAAIGYPGIPKSALYAGGAGRRRVQSVSLDALFHMYAGFADIAISVGHLVEVHASGLLIHNASVMEGQSGGPLIALEDYINLDLDRHANVTATATASDSLNNSPMRFIGINTAGTDFGYNVALGINHPSFVAAYARNVLKQANLDWRPQSGAANMRQMMAAFQQAQLKAHQQQQELDQQAKQEL